MSLTTNRFVPIQAGDAVLVNFATKPQLAGNFQRFISDGGTLVVTTPQGEADPTLQTVHYIDDYESMETGVLPPPQAATMNVGQAVRVKFRNQDSSDLIGTIVATDPVSGTIRIVTAGGEQYACKDFWWVQIL